MVTLGVPPRRTMTLHEHLKSSPNTVKGHTLGLPLKIQHDLQRQYNCCLVLYYIILYYIILYYIILYYIIL